MQEGLGEWLLKCPFKSLKEPSAGSAKAGKFLVIICSIIEVPTFFLPRLLLGSDKMHPGLTVHLCLHFPLFAALVLLLTPNHQALAACISTGNFLSPQTVYSFLSMQFSSQWKPGPLLVCGGFMLGLRWAPTEQQAA